MMLLLKLLAFVPTAFASAAVSKYCGALHWACDGSVGENFVARLANQSMAVMNSVIGALAVLGVLWGAALIATSGANEEGRNKGKSIIITVLVGVTLAILATNILGYVDYVFS